MAKFREPSVGRHYDEAPQVTGEGFRSWITRGRNFAVIYTEARAGAEVPGDFVDEQVIYIVEGRLKIAAGGEQAVLEGEGLAISPPGHCTITPEGDVVFMQVVTDAEAVVARAANASTYADGAPEVTATAEWPMPTDGYRLRTYPLAETHNKKPA